MDALKKGWSLRDIQKFYGIPESRMHLYSKNPNPTGHHKNIVFTLEEETNLAATIREYATHCFDVTSEVKRSLAFQLAENKQIAHPFSVALQMAGPDWFAKFRERNPDVVDSKSVSMFSDKLREIVDREKISSTRIYNVDSCSFAKEAKHWKRIYPDKNTVAPSIVTLVAGFNAAGNFITPFQVLKSCQKFPELTESHGQHIEITKTGQFDGEMFQKWLEHFVEETTPSSKKPVLLILDNQTVNLASWDFAKAHHVILLALPSTNYCLQPVDLTLFEPLEVSFLKLVTSWLEKYNCKITIQQLSQRLTAAYIQIMSRNVAVAGFRDCGLWPIDKKLIDELSAIGYHRCPLCLAEPSSTVAYKNHMKNEHGICHDRPKCPKCTARWFITSSQLERHIWLYHRTSHTCRICRTTMERSEYSGHRCGYECHYCGRLIRCKSALLGHFKVCQIREPTRRKHKPKVTRQPYECFCCSEKFNQKGLLKKHFLLQAQMQRNRPRRLRNLSSIRCEECQLTFTGLRQLNIHIELEHSKL
jgi:DDE superfamily endonuclease